MAWYFGYDGQVKMRKDIGEDVAGAVAWMFDGHDQTQRIVVAGPRGTVIVTVEKTSNVPPEIVE